MGAFTLILKLFVQQLETFPNWLSIDHVSYLSISYIIKLVYKVMSIVPEY